MAGIGPKLAEKIVSNRDENGIYKERTDLKKVAGLGPKAFEQSAGFLRIIGGKNALDASAIHPESYPIANAVMKRLKLNLGATLAERREAVEKLRSEITPEVIGSGIGLRAAYIDRYP